jgi:hypothetical protein
METGRLIGGVVIIVVAAVLLYYLYDYMFNIGSIQKKGEVVSGPISATADVVDYPQEGNLNQIIYTGGEMSVSFWMYVTGTQANSPYKKHIFHLGTRADGTAGNVLAVMLGPTSTNALYIKIAEGADFNLGTYASQNADTSDVAGNCHITNIEFGRWVNVIIVLNNNLCDVYVDGKLSRSCVLKSQFLVPSTTTPIKFFVLKKELGTGTGILTGWDGSFSGMNFYNYALSPDEAYRTYFAGPSGGSGDLWSAIKSFFGAGQKAAAVFTTSA